MWFVLLLPWVLFAVSASGIAFEGGYRGRLCGPCDHLDVSTLRCDRLYSAPITEKGIGAAHLIATDEAIRDAHWAFIKR